MPTFPNRNELTDSYPSPSVAVFKGGIGKLWDAITGLLGTSGSAVDARAALDVPSRAALQGQTYTAFTTGGTSTAYTLTPAPPVGALVENMEFDIEFHTAAGATPTMSISGLLATALKYRDSTGTLLAVTATQIPAGWRSKVVYDGTYLIVREVPPAGASNPTSAGAEFAFTGRISPPQITANQNDYNPVNLATSSTLRLYSDASRDITGLQGGAEGRFLMIHNVGSFDIVLKDESAGSAAANRFALDVDIVLAGDQSCIIQYDSTSGRWRALARPITTSVNYVSKDQGSTEVGSFLFGRYSGVVSEGSTYAGSAINGSGISSVDVSTSSAVFTMTGGNAHSGTWRALGYANNYFGITLFQRVS